MVLVGEGAERGALAAQADALGIAEHVIFTGFQNTPFDYLATFDAFILASKSEGLPRVVLEAMLLNIPVIGSKVTGTAELIDHESTGLLFPRATCRNLLNIWIISGRILLCAPGSPLPHTRMSATYMPLKAMLTVSRPFLARNNQTRRTCLNS